MTVRLKDKVSYIFGRIAHTGNIYSRVVEKDFAPVQKYCDRLYGGVAAGPLHVETVPYNEYTHRNEWLVAQPIKGDSTNFRIYKYTYDHVTNNGSRGLWGKVPAYKEFNKTPLAGVYNQAEAITAIKNWEVSKLPTQRQPFSKRLASNIPAPKN